MQRKAYNAAAAYTLEVARTNHTQPAAAAAAVAAAGASSDLTCAAHAAPLGAAFKLAVAAALVFPFYCINGSAMLFVFECPLSPLQLHFFVCCFRCCCCRFRCCC